jgi:sugar/nucleoside kinase (ribokinase family)
MPCVLFAGLSTIDIQFFVDQFPASNEKVKCQAPDLLAGGPALNAAVAYSFLNDGAQLLSPVGNSAFKNQIFNDLRTHAVRLTDCIEEKDSQAVLASVITSSNGDRSVLSHYPEDHPVNFDVRALFDELQPKLLMVDGFYPNMTLAICEEANSRSIPVVFDGGSWKPYLEQLIPYLDMVICSADFHPPGCASPADVLCFFEQHQKKYIAVSRGADSILYVDNAERNEIAIAQLTITDSLGAGDFLHGAFCYYWLKSRDFGRALGQAAHFASQTCLYAGTRKCFAEIKKEQFI